MAGGGSAAGAGAGGAGIVSAGRTEELAGEARRAEEAVRAARLKKKDADGDVKRLHARGKQLQVGVVVYLIDVLQFRMRHLCTYDTTILFCPYYI